MKLSDDSSRNIGLAIILVGLMIVIIGFGKVFENRLKIAALTQSSMAELTEYEIMDGFIKYKLPEEWLSTSVEEQDESHLYLNEFISFDADIYGYVELINNEKTFDEAVGVFKDDIKGMGVDDIKDERVVIDNIEGELVEYDVNYSDNNVKRIFEYYIPKDKYILRMNFTIDNSKVRENTKVVLNNIAETVKFADKSDN